MEYSNIKDYIEAIKALSSNKIYIAGAGRNGEVLGEYFNKHGIVWEGYVDKRTFQYHINGKSVWHYEELNAQEGRYVISSYSYRKELLHELRQIGVSPDHIIMYGNHDVFFELYDELINWKKYACKIRKFQNLHKGKRCFIIGNGPSLKIRDLERLDKEITFASNSIYALYKTTAWRPTYYCANDKIFCDKMMSDKKDLKMLMDGCKVAFTSILGVGFKYRDDADMDRLCFVQLAESNSKNQLPAFSTDCSERVYLGGTVTYVMLQLAAYMGFEQIYLLGMDFNYSVEQHKNGSITTNNICNHMKEMEAGHKMFDELIKKRYGVSYLADVDLQLAAYQAARKYADANDIKIYNATRGGKLEVFERVNFDNLF